MEVRVEPLHPETLLTPIGESEQDHIRNSSWLSVVPSSPALKSIDDLDLIRGLQVFATVRRAQ
jgi:hypothetical protein